MYSENTENENMHYISSSEDWFVFTTKGILTVFAVD